jgi:hypothetical protein
MEELSVRQPALMLELMRGCGNVLAMRMLANLERAIPVS